MANNQQSTTKKWVKFDEEFTDDVRNDGKTSFDEFIKSRIESNPPKYAEFAKLDKDQGYKGWSMDIRGRLFVFIVNINYIHYVFFQNWKQM